jgi:hypothetical protein
MPYRKRSRSQYRLSVTGSKSGGQTKIPAVKREKVGYRFKSPGKVDWLIVAGSEKQARKMMAGNPGHETYVLVGSEPVRNPPTFKQVVERLGKEKADEKLDEMAIDTFGYAYKELERDHKDEVRGEFIEEYGYLV